MKLFCNTTIDTENRDKSVKSVGTFVFKQGGVSNNNDYIYNINVTATTKYAPNTTQVFCMYTTPETVVKSCRLMPQMVKDKNGKSVYKKDKNNNYIYNGNIDTDTPIGYVCGRIEKVNGRKISVTFTKGYQFSLLHLSPAWKEKNRTFTYTYRETVADMALGRGGNIAEIYRHSIGLPVLFREKVTSKGLKYIQPYTVPSIYGCLIPEYSGGIPTERTNVSSGTAWSVRSKIGANAKESKIKKIAKEVGDIIVFVDKNNGGPTMALYIGDNKVWRNGQTVSIYNVYKAYGAGMIVYKPSLGQKTVSFFKNHNM